MPARHTKSTPRAKTVRRSAPAPDRRSPELSDFWARFAGQLKQCVADLDTDDILIIASKRANQYVQLHHWGFAISAEAASNAYIFPPSALLDERQYARAKALGWNPPTITAELVQELESVDEAYEGSPNFHRTFDLGDAGIVELLVQTLRLVYKVRCPSELHYKSFTSDGSQQIRWTALGIKRYVGEPALPGS